MLTELPVSNPGLPLMVSFKGKRIDEYRLAFFELYIIGAAIFEGHPKFECFSLNCQSSQSSIP